MAHLGITVLSNIHEVVIVTCVTSLLVAGLKILCAAVRLTLGYRLRLRVGISVAGGHHISQVVPPQLLFVNLGHFAALHRTNTVQRRLLYGQKFLPSATIAWKKAYPEFVGEFSYSLSSSLPYATLVCPGQSSAAGRPKNVKVGKSKAWVNTFTIPFPKRRH